MERTTSVRMAVACALLASLPLQAQKGENVSTELEQKPSNAWRNATLSAAPIPV